MKNPERTDRDITKGLKEMVNVINTVYLRDLPREEIEETGFDSNNKDINVPNDVRKFLEEK
jgi:hypothetical protein